MSQDERDVLSSMMQAVASSSGPGVSHSASTGVEFTNNQALVNLVGRSNDPQRLQDVLDGKASVDLSSQDKDFLRHRIQHLNVLQTLEKNLPEKKI